MTQLTVVAIIGLLTVAFIFLCDAIWNHNRQRRAASVPDRIEDIERRARALRNSLDAYAAEYVALHGYGHDTNEADELRLVIYNGQDPDEALRRIMEWKKWKKV